MSSTHLGPAGLAVLVVVVLVGCVLPVVPTGAAVSAAAVLARAEHWWEVPLVVAAGALGAYLGDLGVYAALRRAGEPLARRLGRLHHGDGEAALARVRDQLDARGARAVVLSRLVPGGRLPVLVAAALGGYPVRRFAAAAVVSAVLWAGLYAGVGAAGDAVLDDTWVTLAVVVAVALLVGTAPGLVHRLRKGRS